MVENAIRSQIATLSTIPSTKIKLGYAMRGVVPPYIVVSKLNDDRPFDHDGDDGTSICTIQVDVYDKDYKTCKEYASEIYPLSTFTDSTIAKIRLVNEIDLYDPISEVQQVSMEFTVFRYTE